MACLVGQTHRLCIFGIFVERKYGKFHSSIISKEGLLFYLKTCSSWCLHLIRCMLHVFHNVNVCDRCKMWVPPDTLKYDNIQPNT